jgi:hypothetical protein
LWIDEAAFTRSRVNNLYNLHEWALEKPHTVDSLHLNKELALVPGSELHTSSIHDSESCIMISLKEHLPFYWRTYPLTSARACGFSMTVLSTLFMPYAYMAQL